MISSNKGKKNQTGGIAFKFEIKKEEERNS